MYDRRSSMIADDDADMCDAAWNSILSQRGLRLFWKSRSLPMSGGLSGLLKNSQS